jgi:hypothetical protein
LVNNFYTALYSRLTAGTAANAFLSAMGGTASPRVYHGQAPDGAVLPYYIFSWQGGGYQHDTPSVDVNGVVYGRAYSRVSQVQAGSICEAAFALLDRNPLTVTGWANIGLFAESPHLQFAETDPSGVTTYSSGDEFRVYLDRQ